jgi:hypothetical protein
MARIRPIREDQAAGAIGAARESWFAANQLR